MTNCSILRHSMLSSLSSLSRRFFAFFFLLFSLAPDSFACLSSRPSSSVFHTHLPSRSLTQCLIVWRTFSLDCTFCFLAFPGVPFHWPTLRLLLHASRAKAYQLCIPSLARPPFFSATRYCFQRCLYSAVASSAVAMSSSDEDVPLAKTNGRSGELLAFFEFVIMIAFVSSYLILTTLDYSHLTFREAYANGCG